VLIVPFLLATLTCAFVAVLSCRRRRRTPSAAWLSLAMAGLAWWSAVDTVACLARTEVQLVTIQLAIYPGVATATAGFACLCWSLADPDWRPSRRTLLLVVEPVVITVAALTNPLHELVFVPSADVAERWSLGPVFLAHTVYSYTILGIALAHVLRARRHAPALRTRQLTTLLVAAPLPALATLFTLTGLTGNRDVSALGFVLTGLLDCYAVFRQGLFEVVPVARARVLEELQDAVLVFDEQSRLGDVNAAGLALLARAVPPGRGLIGTPAQDALGGLLPMLAGSAGEHRVDLSDGPADLDVQASALEDRKGRHVGRVLVVRDISVACAQRAELADANASLQKEIATVELLRAEVAEQAVRDPLTGCHNRRHLARVLHDGLRRAADDGRPLSVVMVDVDRFKSVNDTHGHAVGDVLLQALAQCLRAAVRGSDTVARYGGEEFVILLPGSSAADALRRAEHIRQQCALVLVQGCDGLALTVTVSAGVATTCPGTRTAEELLEAADQALYRAKRGGRDRAESALVAV
jgi:diguanylate cyclase (GGDEF)-like protein